MKIGLARRGYSSTGGAESYLRRFVAALRAAGHEAVIFGSPEWPAGARPEGAEFVPVAGGSPQAFSNALRALRPHASGLCDVLFSLERVAHCDCFRAGDGVHRAWLEHRARGDNSLWKRVHALARAWNPKHRQLLALERALFAPDGSGARAVVANSQMVAREIVAHYQYPPARIRTIYNGLSDEFFEPMADGVREQARRELALDAQDYAVLFAGSGWERKGLRFALAAIAQLDPAHRGVLLIAGAGKRRALPSLANDERRVRFLGPVPGAKMRALYAAADVFLLPTLYDPFSNACLEAFASGLPVVTTAQNGFAEILLPAVTGERVDFAWETGALTASLARWADAERRRAARPKILARAADFRMETNLAETLDFLTHLPPARAGF